MTDGWSGWTTVWWLPVVAAPFVGSFLGVLIARLPAGEPVAFARSRCRSCGARLGCAISSRCSASPSRRGRCRLCGSPIGWFSAGIEVAAVVVAVWAATEVRRMAVGDLRARLGAAGARRHRCPPPDPAGRADPALIPAGLLVVAIALPERLVDHLAGAAVGFAVLAAVRLLYRRLARP